MVYLVGAGPGDPELLTLKGKRVLGQADAVLYDELANPALLDWAPARAERCYVGKRARHHALPQAEIAAWMIERAQRGLCVVRLKGGDPLIFGRGGEEIEALARAGVAWEVVPGVSAGTGVAAAAGIPLTHRGLSSGVRFLAGHTGLAAAALNPNGETLVVFMGLERLAESATALIARGWPRTTPATVIERGTLPGERMVTATLAGIAAKVRRAAMQSPALVIVGAVAGLPARWRRSGARSSPATTTALPGLILMAHGSPLPGWQTGVDQLARSLAAPGQFSRAAYLPPVRPSLSEVVGAAAAAGVRRLAVVPYFLAPGLHVTRDLPELVAAERQRHPGIEMALAPCLEGHPALRTAVLARAGEAALSWSHEAKIGGTMGTLGRGGRSAGGGDAARRGATSRDTKEVRKKSR
jgi:uroporphyrin-III C-methyltransferase